MNLGPIALLGSGETSLAGGRIFESIARNLPQPIKIAVMETPAGFELNSSQVAGKVADFLKNRLQNYSAVVEIVPARKRGTFFSPDELQVLHPLLDANMIFMGPGSPTYAIRQLQDSLAWNIIRARQRMGVALVFASAATIAVGACALPVYEIYKVGQDVFSPPGLDLFSDFGLSVSCIPHWNNTDGGDDVDTSRCFIGMERFDQWCGSLPEGYTVLGLDEHTGIIIDFSTGTCAVKGVSSVTILQGCEPRIHPAGSQFPLTEIGIPRIPRSEEEGIPEFIWKMVTIEGDQQSEIPPEIVLKLAKDRLDARNRKEWALADELRLQVSALGWTIRDTPEGQEIVKT